MKRISLIVIASLLLVYTAGWFIAAGIAKNKILEALENLKAQHTISSYSTTIKIKGFPFNFDIALESPNVQINGSNPASEYNVLYDGTVSLRVGLFSNSIKLITNGDLHLRGTLPGYKFYLVATGEDTNYKITLTDFLASPTFIKQLIKIKGAPNSFVSLIDSVSIQGKRINITNKLTNNYLLVADKIDIESTVKATKDRLKLEYKENLVNAQFSNESLNIWHAFNTTQSVHQLVSKINPKVVSYFNVFTLPKFGKMNHKIKLNIDKDAAKCDVSIDTLDISDALENISASGSIYISPNQTKLNVTSDKKFAPAYYDLIQIYLKSIDSKGGSLTALAGIDQHLGKLLAPISGKQTKNYSLAAVLKGFGEIKTDVNLIYKEEAANDYAVDIKKFKVKTDAFSIASKGEFQRQAKKDTYSFKIDADNYEYITDVVLDYIDGNQLNKTAFLILNVNMNDSVRHDIKDFIRDISDDPTSKSQDISLTIVNKDGGKYPGVGRYNSKEFENRVDTLAATIATREIKQKVQDVQNLAKAITNLSKDPTDAISSIVSGIFK